MLLTTHEAAGYLCQRYKIRLLTPLGLSTTEEVRPADLAQLLEDIQKYKVKTLFSENGHNQILAEKIVAKAKVKLGGTIYLDGLSDVGGPADTVEKMLRYNLNLIYQSMVD